MVIKALTRKLLRDLWQMKAQVLTIALVIGGGTASMVSALSVVKSLQEARDDFYRQGNFADVFSDLKRAPLASLGWIQDKATITDYETRVSLLGRLWRSSDEIPLTVRVQSYNDPVTDINRLFLRQGRWPAKNQNEVVVSEAFYLGAGFHLGERVAIIAEGQTQYYNITGVVIGPEFAYTLKPGAPLPDDKHFGVLWGEYDRISKDFGYNRAFNSLVVRAAPGVSIREVIDDVDEGLAKYGGLGAYGRDAQLSHFFVTDELRQQRVTATIFPSVFLTVSAFLLNMILSRLVRTQREQIAVLRALGYTRFEIIRHYFYYILLTIFIGALIGSLLGYWQGQGMIRLYKEYFRFLQLPFRWNWGAFSLSLLGNLLFGLIAILQVLWQLHRQEPAEILRPEPPAIYKGKTADRIFKNFRLKPTLRMTLRGLLSRPGRTLISVLALAFASVILILGIFWWDSINYLLSIHFNRVLKADTLVTFINPVPHAAILTARQKPGILRAEGYRQIPVKIHSKNKSVLTSLEAVQDGQQLKTLLDENQLPLQLPSSGLMLSRGWADKLELQVGDFITLETLENEKKVFVLPVAKVVDDLVGSQAYIGIEELRSLLKEGVVYNSLLLKTEGAAAKDFLASLKSVPMVASVDSKLDVLKSFQASTAQVILIFASALLIFATVIAVGVVYNTARISLSEKARILASLRILGFTHQEVFFILFSEVMTITLSSIPLGAVLGYFFASLSVRAMRTESFRMPFYMEPHSFVFATMVVLASSVATAFVLRQRVRNLDIISTLKGQE